MNIAIFDTKSYTREFFVEVNEGFHHQLKFFEPRLNAETAPLARDCETVCVFVNDRLDAGVVDRLADAGVKLIALRCAGFNNVDVKAAKKKGIPVARVPAYSPYAVAEHTVALMLGLNRKTHRAYNRVRDGNFALEGLLGFDLHGKTVGIVGTGRIGLVLAAILRGFGCRLLGYDPRPRKEAEALGVAYVDLPDLLGQSDIVSLHTPLMPATHHLIDRAAVGKMKRGTMLINTSRGGLVETQAVIDGLKSGQIGYLGLDVYEEEGDLFFEDLSGQVIQDDVFARLLTFPNVLITGHQAFFTRTALRNIAETTLGNIADFAGGGVKEAHLVTEKMVC